jgi:hypothetical protein
MSFGPEDEDPIFKFDNETSEKNENVEGAGAAGCQWSAPESAVDKKALSSEEHLAGGAYTPLKHTPVCGNKNFACKGECVGEKNLRIIREVMEHGAPAHAFECGDTCFELEEYLNQLASGGKTSRKHWAPILTPVSSSIEALAIFPLLEAVAFNKAAALTKEELGDVHRLIAYLLAKSGECAFSNGSYSFRSLINKARGKVISLKNKLASDPTAHWNKDDRNGAAQLLMKYTSGGALSGTESNTVKHLVDHIIILSREDPNISTNSSVFGSHVPPASILSDGLEIFSAMDEPGYKVVDEAGVTPEMRRAFSAAKVTVDFLERESKKKPAFKMLDNESRSSIKGASSEDYSSSSCTARRNEMAARHAVASGLFRKKAVKPPTHPGRATSLSILSDLESFYFSTAAKPVERLHSATVLKDYIAYYADLALHFKNSALWPFPPAKKDIDYEKGVDTAIDAEAKRRGVGRKDLLRSGLNTIRSYEMTGLFGDSSYAEITGFILVALYMKRHPPSHPSHGIGSLLGDIVSSIPLVSVFSTGDARGSAKAEGEPDPPQGEARTSDRGEEGPEYATASGLFSKKEAKPANPDRPAHPDQVLSDLEGLYITAGKAYKLSNSIRSLEYSIEHYLVVAVGLRFTTYWPIDAPPGVQDGGYEKFADILISSVARLTGKSRRDVLQAGLNVIRSYEATGQFGGGTRKDLCYFITAALYMTKHPPSSVNLPLTAEPEPPATVSAGASARDRGDTLATGTAPGGAPAWDPTQRIKDAWGAPEEPRGTVHLPPAEQDVTPEQPAPAAAPVAEDRSSLVEEIASGYVAPPPLVSLNVLQSKRGYDDIEESDSEDGSDDDEDGGEAYIRGSEEDMSALDRSLKSYNDIKSAVEQNDMEDEYVKTLWEKSLQSVDGDTSEVQKEFSGRRAKVLDSLSAITNEIERIKSQKITSKFGGRVRYVVTYSPHKKMYEKSEA